MTSPAVIAVDWGTTSFRLWSLAADGDVLAERRSAQGMSTLAPGDYASLLEGLLAEIEIGPAVPTLVCGMAGAAQGWRNAPYLDLPVNLKDAPAAAVAAPMGEWERDVRILPGLAQRRPEAPDVIRGEETLLLGARLADGVEGTVCLPGTHSKWARLQGDVVTGFRTAMTGEAFALLAEHSTLSHFASGDDAEPDDPAFVEAVRESLAQPQALLNALFSVRAGPLLFGEEAAATARARLSGLLIGAEIAASAPKGEAVTLLAGGGLSDVYAAALTAADIPYATLDAEATVRAGLYHAARQLWPQRFGAAA